MRGKKRKGEKEYIDERQEAIDAMWDEVEPSRKKKEEKRHHYYAPGDNHDRLYRNQKAYKQYRREAKPKRHWGIRIFLFILLMLAMVKFNKPLFNNSRTSDQFNTNQSAAEVKVNYRLKDYIFIAEQSDETEVSIREFLNIYHIDYSDFRYDSDAGYYIVALSDDTVFSTEDSVKEKREEMQQNFVTYCSGTGSNHGVQAVSVEYQYN